MGTIKKFRTYLLLFIVMFLFIGLFTNIAMRENFVDITNHIRLVTSPKIVITESKASYSRGYIKGNITNDTGEHIKDKYLQFDFYDKDGIYVGTKTQEIKYFNVEEKISFDIDYEFQNVEKINIDFVDEVIKPKSKISSLFNLDDEDIKIAAPIALGLVLYTIIP